MAQKSENRLFVKMNKNFVIKWQIPGDSKWQLSTAAKIGTLIGDEELKLRLFFKALNSGQHVTTVKIRQRINLKFHSK